jgi:hypothetical protein
VTRAKPVILGNQEEAMLKELRVDEAAPWKTRYRVKHVSATQIASTRPARGLATSNQDSDTDQLYAWDVPAGRLRQLTDRPAGTKGGWLSPDGRYVYNLEDEQGDEIGHIVRLPFEGGEPQD